MQAAYYSAFGAPADVLQVGELPAPQLETQEDVLINVFAGSINPADFKQMDGSNRVLMDRPFPVRPGFDFCGRVYEMGEIAREKSGLQVGDDVYGMVLGLRTGGTSQKLCVHYSVLAKKPENLTPVQAAGVPLAALTAMQCFLKGGIPLGKEKNRGKSVLITGGPGGVGVFAIQLAKKMFGVDRVVTTASATKAELCSRLGADLVVDYRKGPFWTQLKDEKFDFCLDCTGDASKMIPLTKDGGGVVSITASPDAGTLIDWIQHMGPSPGIVLSPVVKSVVLGLPSVVNLFTGAWWLNYRGRSRGVRFDHLITISNKEQLEQISKLLLAGELEVVIDKVFPLADAPAAYARSAAGAAVGKIIVEMPAFE